VEIADIDAGPSGSFPNLFTASNGMVFFRADDGTTNDELWKTDGTGPGTVLVKDINPTPDAGSFPNRLTDFAGALYFSANDGVHGIELWRSDGTPDGTVLVQDLEQHENASSDPRQLTVSGSTLFFSAYTIDDGKELWRTPIYVPPAPVVTPVTAATPCSASLKRSRKPKAKTSRKTFLVDAGLLFRCVGGAPTAGAWRLSASAVVPASLARKVKKKRVVLGTAKKRVAAGKTSRITFKLNKRGARILRRLRKVKLQLKIVIRPVAGKSKTVKKTITVRKPKVRKKRRR
jgi:ELWxxDGT repeat protein